MPAFARGEVVLVRFPFTDLSGVSVRPALVVSDGMFGQDLVLAAISSVTRASPPGTDLPVDAKHPEFAATGLRVSSVIRLHKLVTVERSVVLRRLGRIGPKLQAEARRRLKSVFGF